MIAWIYYQNPPCSDSEELQIYLWRKSGRWTRNLNVYEKSYGWINLLSRLVTRRVLYSETLLDFWKPFFNPAEILQKWVKIFFTRFNSESSTQNVKRDAIKIATSELSFLAWRTNVNFIQSAYQWSLFYFRHFIWPWNETRFVSIFICNFLPSRALWPSQDLPKFQIHVLELWWASAMTSGRYDNWIWGNKSTSWG